MAAVQTGYADGQRLYEKKAMCTDSIEISLLPMTKVIGALDALQQYTTVRRDIWVDLRSIFQSREAASIHLLSYSTMVLTLSEAWRYLFNLTLSR